jgi:hypothetical protein
VVAHASWRPALDMSAYRADVVESFRLVAVQVLSGEITTQRRLAETEPFWFAGARALVAYYAESLAQPFEVLRTERMMLDIIQRSAEGSGADAATLPLPAARPRRRAEL